MRLCAYTLSLHSRLGPGLLENPYERCLEHELASSGFTVNTKGHLPGLFDLVLIDIGYRLDLLANSRVVVEMEAFKRCCRCTEPRR